ncbi:hypothetical protein Pfo_014906 [Paulownia fortunei]|nr:hypothetical protein Pfo_014906 [Paulownia fortunei]
MLPISDTSPYSKPKTPEILDRKHSYFTALKPYLSFHHRRTWFFLSVLLLQLLLLLSAPSLPFSLSAANTSSPRPSPALHNLTYDNPTAGEQGFRDGIFNNPASNEKCPYGKVYVYNLPPLFNTEIVRNCHNLNPWSSRCDALSNSGFGKTADGISRILPQNVSGAWFWTDQFSLELIYHNRMLNYRCRTLEPESAAAFYIPFYTGLAIERFLFTSNSTSEERDRHCKLMLNWVSDQPFFKKSHGWDHFLTVGRISWDFRRSRDEDWGSSCIYMPKMRNITRLLIEKNPWDYFDVAVPYPTGFHPSSISDLRIWQDFVSSRQRRTLFCFAGATRGFIKNDFRGILLSQCYSEPGSCRVVDCGGSKCANGSSAILETFLDSVFCLQPRGDSFTRRSIFDCMVAGSIPVFFWHRTAYLQYEWFLPGEPESYSVFIDRNEVKNGTSIKAVLEKISKEKVKRMREKVIEYIPKIIYANSNQGLEGMGDAFDVAVEGFLRRVKEQDGGKTKQIGLYIRKCIFILDPVASVVIGESQSSEQKKQMKKAVAPDIVDDSNSAEEKIKKEKKKELKRKAFEINSGDNEEEEKCEPMNSSNKKKKMKFDKNEEEKEDENPNSVSNFRISKPLREALQEKGIESLFPIQAMTFNTILDGSDLVGMARTGQTGYGRAPSVLVLLPTRELATQVFSDFEVYGGALGLKSCCLYGGSPYLPQQIQLKRGVDVVVGTPGRIKDHIERGNIDLSALKFRVLDEADEMLRMGFVEDVELILGKVEDASKVQTLLFSATLPDWVKHIAAKFLKRDKQTADLVGNERMKASTNVRHIVLPCSSSARSQLIPDIIRCYSSGGRTIIFTETKDSASTLAGLLPGARALHGAIQQATREIREILTLVATNVAARGLDIDDVQLIIQCEPPCDVEAYIHRSGRTGRARKTGVAVMLYDPRKSNFSSRVKFEHISAPQPADIAKAAGAEAAEKITEISDSVVPLFKAAAEELLNSSVLSPTELLAKALAKAAGYTEIKSRSLLTSMENYVTGLLECGRLIYRPSFAYGVLRRFLLEEKVESIKGLALTADGRVQCLMWLFKIWTISLLARKMLLV